MRKKWALWAGIGLVVVLGGVGVWLYLSLQLTPQTALSLDPNNLAVLSPPTIDPPVVATTQPSDATNDYRQAWLDYQSNTDACENFTQNPTETPPQAIALILDAAGKSTAEIFASRPADVVDYQTDHPALDQLVDLARLLDQAGLRLKLQNQLDKARMYFLAVHALGEKLYAERLTYDEYSKGLSLMNESTMALADCEPPDRAADLHKYEGALRDYDANHVQPIYQAIVSAEQEDIALHAGDIIAFATKSKERMFRIEAILALGRLKFDAARNADQQAAPRLIQQSASDPDPAVQAAVAAADGLTLDQYHTIH
jgi:hypothetical protein